MGERESWIGVRDRRRKYYARPKERKQEKAEREERNGLGLDLLGSWASIWRVYPIEKEQTE